MPSIRTWSLPLPVQPWAIVSQPARARVLDGELGDQRPGERREQRIAAAVERVRLDRRQHVVALRTPRVASATDRVDGAEVARLADDHVPVLAGLAEVDGQRDDLGPVALLDPVQHHRGVEAAASTAAAPGRPARGRPDSWRCGAPARSSAGKSAHAAADSGDHWRVRRVAYILSVALITAGLVIGADVAMTLAWKEPLSTIYGSIKQGQAEDTLAALEGEFPSPADLQAVERGDRTTVEAARGLARRPVRRAGPRPAQGIGRIKIPSDRRSTTSSSRAPTRRACRRAPATTRRPPSPARARRSGSPATGPPTWRRSATSTRSTTATRSRSRCPTGPSPTRSKSTRSSTRARREIVDNVGYERLVLTACHPLYSAAQRWAVFAKLTDVTVNDG